MARAREATAEAVAVTAAVVGGRWSTRRRGGSDAVLIEVMAATSGEQWCVTEPGAATAQLDRPKHEASLHLARSMPSARGQRQVVRAGPIYRADHRASSFLCAVVDSIPPVQDPLLTRVSARSRPELSIMASAALVAPMRRRLQMRNGQVGGLARGRALRGWSPVRGPVAGALTDRN